MNPPARLDPTDTIAAIASPPGPGHRGIVRLSGPRARSIARAGFEPDAGRPMPDRAAWCRGRLPIDGLRVPVPAALATWPAPRTYTGQEVAEIHTVGSPPVLRAALAQCLARGARAAEPGEFTLRAFLNGRLDLTRAEAVLGVIDAETPAQLDAALRQLAGGLAGPIARARDRLLEILAHLEAGLDFAEEPDVDPLHRSDLAEALAAAAAEVRSLADRLGRRDRPEGNPRVVLVGPPNAGKSRLFNALLGAPRALVSDRAGTTRDYLSAPCDCAGLVVELVDTAGSEAPAGPIAERAQAQRRAQLGRADLVLDCRSADVAAGPMPDAPHLLVWTKADLAPKPVDPDLIATSAADGNGLDRLRAAIAEAIQMRSRDGLAVAATAARCRDGLGRAGGALQSAAETLRLSAGEELVAIDLRTALDELGKVVGQVVTEDLLDRIFGKFCIGK